jgi:two-component system response regulator FixJ
LFSSEAVGADSMPDNDFMAPRVYIVDDDGPVRKALRRLVGAAGYEVEAFTCAEDYLAGGPVKVPACLVLDMRMPGMSGLDLQRVVKGTERDLPIVFITGHGDEEARAQAMDAGAVDVLQKPLDGDALLTAIARALATSPQP